MPLNKPFNVLPLSKNKEMFLHNSASLPVVNKKCIALTYFLLETSEHSLSPG